MGTDGSGTASEAVKQAAELARKFDAELVLLSAFDKRSGASSGGDERQWTRNSASVVRSKLERAEAELSNAGINCRTIIDEGDPADVIVRLAEECGADMLVIGNKGMKRRVLGSVPNKVTHKADCSVLVVKTS